MGYLAWRWLYVDLLWVDEPLRGSGYGTELLTEAERVAREAGCVAARLDTYEFQATPFYERHGYVVYGVLEGYPADTRQYFLRKSLSSSNFHVMSATRQDRQPTERDARFVGSIPELYDRYLGPLLFAPYADDLVQRVHAGAGPNAAVLEVAAGTGILSERLRACLSPDVRLTISDLNAPMLAIARRRLAQAGRSGVDVRVADAMSLPFDDASFDAVVSQFGVMFFPDKGQAARETYRVLRPGGQWLFNVWGSWDENSFARIVHETITGFFTDAPEFYRVPFSLYDARVLRSIVVDAGFTDPAITTLDLVAEAPSAAEAAIGLVRGNPVAAAIEDRGTVDPETIVGAVAGALARAFGDHPLRFPMRVRVVDTRRPDEPGRRN